MKLHHRFVIVAWILFAGCGRPSSEPTSAAPHGSTTKAEPLTPVSLMLNWYRAAEHGGYYAALVHGYFAETGLDVTIIPGRLIATVVQHAARGEVDFGVT